MFGARRRESWTGDAKADELAVARALEECLEAMEKGETDLDALAARYPHARKQIRPLLDIAAKLGEPPPTRPLAVEFLLDLGDRLRTEVYR